MRSRRPTYELRITDLLENQWCMPIVHVSIHVKPEFVDAFRQATIENARNSIREQGIARFEALQQADDPSRFLLIEIYRDAGAQARHRETAHYATWRDTVAEMMAEPRIPRQHTRAFFQMNFEFADRRANHFLGAGTFAPVGQYRGGIWETPVRCHRQAVGRRRHVFRRRRTHDFSRA